MMNLNRTIHLFLSKVDNLECQKIVCGFSGGADSTALLHLLKSKSEFFKYQLEAVFFSHGGSPIAEEQETVEFCKQFCNDNEIPLQIVSLELDKEDGTGWECAGRRKRQDFYEQEGCKIVFLGHHMGDQDETTMVQMFRGGKKGLCGMKPIDGIYYRPLLGVNKTDIYDYLKAHGIPWIEDPTNANADFTRNFWRNIGLPTISKHYPQYGKQLDNFRQHQTELNLLARDLALNDGLLALQNGNSISVAHLSKIRLKNLLFNHFGDLGINYEDAFYNQQISHYFKNGQVTIGKDGQELSINQGNISPSNLHKITNRPC